MTALLARDARFKIVGDAADASEALRGGAAGYLLKTTEGEALTAAIERTLAGESVIAPEMTS